MQEHDSLIADATIAGRVSPVQHLPRYARTWKFWRLGNRRNSDLSYAFKLILTFLLYFVAGRVGLAVPFTSANVSPVWPAAGVGIALVLIWGVRVAPAIAAAAFLVNFLSPIPTLAALIISIGNVSSAVTAAYLLRHFAEFEVPLSRLRDAVRLVIFGAMLATTIAASVGVSGLAITHTRAWSGYASALRVWWFGDAMGVLVVAPLILNFRQLRRTCRGWRVLELCLVSVAVLVVSSMIFGPWGA